MEGACLMQCYLTPLGLWWSTFVYQPGCNVMFCFWSPQFECDRPEMLTSLRMTGWQHRRELFPQRSLVYLRALPLWFWKRTIQNINRDTLSSFQTGLVDLHMLTNQLAGGRVRKEGCKRKQLSRLYLKYNHINECSQLNPHFHSSLAPSGSTRALLVWTLLRSAVMPWESDMARGSWGGLVRGRWS